MLEGPIDTKRLGGIHRGSALNDFWEETSQVPSRPSSSLPAKCVLEVSLEYAALISRGGGGVVVSTWQRRHRHDGGRDGHSEENLNCRFIFPPK